MTSPTAPTSSPPHVHLIGIGGAGMSGIARILLQRGGSVSGSDLREGRALDELRMLGARIDVGHDASHIAAADIVVISTAVPERNPELAAAREQGCTVLRRAEMLARLMDGQQAALVAGTHGKTTTTSMTVVALQAGGRDPSFAIGGSLNESGTNAHAGVDGLFVAEADESDRSFLVYRPDLAVVTNLEHDHPDEFVDLDDVTEAFTAFAARRTPGAPALLCADDEGTRALAEVIADPVVLFGTDARASFRTIPGEDGQHVLRHEGRDIARFSLAVPGRHNVLNATAALASCALLDVDPADAAPGLAGFTGAARRFQHLGSVDGVDVVDDYAHHPTELRATLAAARTRGYARVVAVVQPHRFSRTQVFGAELGRAAAAADVVVVTEVYGSGEAPVPGVSGRTVADAATAAGAAVHYEPHLADVVEVLLGLVRPGDLVLTTGAGDVTQVGPALLERLGHRVTDETVDGPPLGDAIVSELRAAGVREVVPAAALASLTTLRVGGPARVLAVAERDEDLAAIGRACREHRVPWLIVGRGSNLLVPDAGWPGVAIQLGRGYRGMEPVGSAHDTAGDRGRVRVGAAEPLPSLAVRVADAGFAGFAWACAVPGTLGGAVRMNAGAHGGEMADHLVEVDVVRLGTGVREVWPAEVLGLRYRHSELPHDALVVAATLEFERGDPAAIRAEIDEIRTWRRTHQPLNQPNCGSVFTNPPGDSAGRLIEAAGGKAIAVGGAAVSQMHANFVVTRPGASAADVAAVIAAVQELVTDRFGVHLSTEVVRPPGPAELSGPAEPSGPAEAAGSATSAVASERVDGT